MDIPVRAHLNGVPEVSRTGGTAGNPDSGKRQDASADGKDLPPTEESGVTQQEVVDAIRDISAYVQAMSAELQFQLDDSSNITVITVTDRDTSEVIRQIPTEEAVAIARHIAANAPDPLLGLLVNGQG